jgi:hypothetical protein
MKILNTKLSLLAFSLSLIGCSTYVPVEYRTASEFIVSKGTPLNISFSKENSFTSMEQEKILSHFKALIQKDGWWKIQTPQDKIYYEVIIGKIQMSAELDTSSEAHKDDGIYRLANYKGSGTGEFSIKKNSEKEGKIFLVEKSVTENSTIKLKESAKDSSFIIIVNALIGESESERKIREQDAELANKTLEELRSALTEELFLKITPNRKWARVQIEDDNDDMKPVENFVEKRDYQSAYNYLTALQNQNTRSDIFYNLGVIQEARQFHAEGCGFYQKAYELEAKPMYLEQKSACETRVAEMSKINI